MSTVFIAELILIYKNMTITKNETKKTANLARINIEQQEEKFTGELNDILVMVEQLNEVNTDGVKSMTSVAPMELPQRKDEVTDGGIRDDVLQNAPNKEHGCFAVPKVIE